MGAGHGDTVCLAWTRIPDSQKESWSSAQDTVCRKRHKEPLLAVWWEASPNPHSSEPAKGQPWKQDFLRIRTLRPVQLSLLNSTFLWPLDETSLQQLSSVVPFAAG